MERTPISGTQIRQPVRTSLRQSFHFNSNSKSSRRVGRRRAGDVQKKFFSSCRPTLLVFITMGLFVEQDYFFREIVV